MVKSLRQVDCSHPTSHYILTFLLPPPPPEENPIRDRISAAPSLWQMFIQQILPILFSRFSKYFYVGSFPSAFKCRLNF